MAQALLLCLPVEGRVITADALHTQKDFMLVVDANARQKRSNSQKEPTHALCGSGHLFCRPARAPLEPFSTLDRHRGRIEVRSIRVSTEMNSYLTDWPLIRAS